MVGHLLVGIAAGVAAIVVGLTCGASWMGLLAAYLLGTNIGFAGRLALVAARPEDGSEAAT